jgi:transposase InsO family protein
MPYTTNPHWPRLRAQAVEMVEKEGRSMRAVARYYGVEASTVMRWVRKSPEGGSSVIPTTPSRPKRHPKQLRKEVVAKIVEVRKRHGRCAEVVHRTLLNEGVQVSLSSVKRTLEREGLLKKRSPWKRFHLSGERPQAASPGDLVETDTIHLMKSEKERIYVYTLIDVCSRWTYAWAIERLSARRSVEFLKRAQKASPFLFETLQSDHGPEFTQHFTERVGVAHRHSRVRKPNDQAHVERFNRTIQEELLDGLPRNVRSINRLLPKYLKYYNEERLHLGLELKTPVQML